MRRTSDSASHMVDGEDFLRILFNYLVSNERELLSKKLNLILNPSCLRYVNVKLATLSKPRILIFVTNSPTESMHSQNFLQSLRNKPLSHTELLDLKYLLENVCSLKNVLEHDVLEIDMSLFKDLKILELEGYNPALLTHINPETTKLEVIIVRAGKHNMTSFHELFGTPMPICGDELISGIWKHLQVLDCSHNQLQYLDDCLTTLNFLRRLDASHNNIKSIENLQFCYNLEYVDLGFNFITNLTDVAKYLGNVRVLILSNNGLTSLSGLERVLGLEKLDLKNNILSAIEELQKVSKLPFLQAAWFKGNPFTLLKDYRKMAYVMFNSEKLLLDGKPPSDSEITAVKEHRQNTSATIKAHVSVDAVKYPKTPKKANRQEVHIEEKDESEYEHQPKEEEIDEFIYKVKDFHENLGDKWLLVYDKYQKEINPRSSPEKTLTEIEPLEVRKVRKPKRKKLKKVKNFSGKMTGSSPETEDSDYLKNFRPSSSSPRRRGIPIPTPSASDASAEISKSTSPGSDLLKPNSQSPPHAGVTPPASPNRALSNRACNSGARDDKSTGASPTSGDDSTADVERSIPSKTEKPVSDAQDVPVPVITLDSPESQSPTDLKSEENSAPEIERPVSPTNPFAEVSPTNPFAEVSPTNPFAEVSPTNPFGEVSMTSPAVDKTPSAPESKENTPNEVLSPASLRKASTDVFLEEFYVEVQVDRGGDNNFVEWEPRFLFVDNAQIREVDTISATDVAVLELSDLVSTERSSRTTVSLLFVSPLFDKSNITFNTEVFRMRSDEADKFFGIMNSKPLKKLKCLQCGSAFSPNPQAKVVCSNCKSDYVILLDSQQAAEISEMPSLLPPHLVRSELKKEITKKTTPPESFEDFIRNFDKSGLPFEISEETEEEEQHIINPDVSTDTNGATSGKNWNKEMSELNFELYFRINFFSDGDEHTVEFERTGYLLFGVEDSEEQAANILISTNAVYILRDKLDASNMAYELVTKFPISSITHVTIGMFFQYLRIETDTCGAHVILTRSFKQTERLYRTIDRITNKKVSSNKNRATLSNIRRLLFPQSVSHYKPKIEAYILVYQHVSQPSNFTCVADVPGPVLPRTLILTDKEVALCSEEYGKWPTLNLDSVSKPKSPQFTLVGSPQTIHDVVSVKFYDDYPNRFTVVFEEEGQSKVVSWDLITQAKGEKAKFITRLSSLWSDIFQIPMHIEHCTS